ncbi:MULTISPECIES: hybrid-cluster NAD(P)-dependent oxidoreductase [Rhodomicrobium]|uniref:hybrid-cluster NAD(P)-dependent oxidoreductase n=1 Tax=Rhodomicrobium TaxID=1068 RepID=UPI000B4BEFE4|nr:MULTISPECIES: hybrid-cluster NAD(P)-dependent oxidoreductase [Rhodomicrobium]
MEELSTPLPDWDSEADDVLVCRQVRRETHDVATFVFSARKPCLFRFKPGQFLTLDLSIGGEAVNRCYTISASAARPYRISITVKRQPGGIVSNWLHDHLKSGGQIRAIGPLGSFTPAPSAGRKWLMLSGGSGITPLMSMTRTACDLAEDRDIVFVHAAREPADIIFRHELDAMALQMPSLRLAHLCETVAGEAHWPGFTGRLSLPMLRLIAPDFLEREIFCCGPAPFMAAVRAMLGEAGFAMSRYSQESFDFAELAPAEQAEVSETVAAHHGDSFRVEFAKSGRIIECAPDTTILAAAKAAGLRLPSSCTRGLCGTCKSRILSGTLDMRHEGGIRQREIDNGLALLCCSKPTSDLVIDR